MRTGHVGAHFMDEIVAGRFSSWTFSFAFRTAVGGFLRAGGTVFDAKDDVEKLNQRGLSIATTAILTVRLVASTSSEYDTVR